MRFALNARAALLFLALALAQTACFATTYYVSTTGSDATGDGSASKPWATINYADANGLLVAGDEVVVQAGTYVVGPATMKIDLCSGAPGNPITYRANGAVVIQSTATSADFGVAICCNHIVFDGFKITGSGCPIVVGHFDWADYVEVKNCHTTSNLWCWKGFVLRGAKYARIHNNLIGPYPVSGSIGFAQDWGGTDNKVYNNTIVECTSWGAHFDGANGINGGGVEFKNNIIKDCGNGLYDTVGTLHTYNMLYGVIGTWFGATGQAEGETTDQDPAFVDQEFGDYTLTPGSPAIDAGTLVGLPFNDAWPDMGAFESEGVPNTTPLATVTGTVTDAETGALLAGVAITTDKRVSGFTDANGVYTLQLLSGNTQFAAAKAGYVTSRKTLNVAEGSQTLDFQLYKTSNKRYVSPTGSDSNDGLTPETAWATIDYGDRHSLLQPGYEVHVAEGDYYCGADPAILIAACPGTEGNPVKYIADGVVNIHLTNSGYWSLGLEVSTRYITVNGFNFIGEGGNGHGIHVYAHDTHHFEMLNCRTTSLNRVWKSVLLRGVKQSLIHNNVIGPLGASARGLCEDWCDPVGGNKYYNNTIVEVVGWAVDFWGENNPPDRSPREFKNNIIKDCVYGICATDALDHKNNMLFGISYEPYMYSGNSPADFPAGQCTQDPSEITDKDPLFIDQELGDYHLQSVAEGYPEDSPAIDAGIFVGLPFNDDFPDIGAFESPGVPHSPDFGNITGTVRVDGSPLAGASVSVGPIVDTTDDNGVYTLVNVPVGVQSVTAGKTGYEAVIKTVEVVSMETATLDFDLVPAEGPAFYVGPDGSDETGDGSAGNPWATIDYADQNNLLSAGYTVKVLPGDYTLGGTSDAIPGIKISKTAGVTYKAMGDVRVHFTNTNAWSIGLEVSAANTVFDGFTFIGEGASGHGLHVYAHDTYGFELKNCRVTSEKHVWKSVLLRGMKNSSVHNNVIGPISNEANGSSAGLCEDWSDPVGGNKHYNNTIVGVFGWAVDFFGSGNDRSPREFSNNIIKDCLYGIYATDSLVHKNNMLHNIGYTPYTYSGNPDAGLGEGQVTQDPSEKVGVDPMLNENLVPMAGSPAIDAGIPVGLPFNGPWPDIGAFETVGDPHSGEIAAVTGKVTNASGTAIEGATVTAGPWGNVSAVTNADGDYSMTVPVGSQTMSASKPGYSKATKTVTLVAGANTVDFQLGSASAVTRLSELKGMADGVLVSITDAKVVTVSSTTFTAGFYYIQEIDRTCGIKIRPEAGLASVSVGDTVKLTGTLGTDAGGERFLTVSSIDSKESGTAALPLGMTNKSAVGVTGLLVRVWGEVGLRSADFVYVDDGSGLYDGTNNGAGIRVMLGGLNTPITEVIGAYALFTGVVAKTAGGVAVVLPRGDGDVQ